MERCILCQLLSGELEASVVHRDELCSVFVDIRPVNPGHVLVVPNRHAASLAELEEREGAAIFHLATRMAAALRRTELRCEGVNLFLADGAEAGQEIFHAHLHVFPRYRGDGFGLRFGPHYQKARRSEMDAVASALRTALDQPAGTND
jgi:histidine triad (HIT) family protein